MRLLLDTHIFLWWTRNDRRLPIAHRDAIAFPLNVVYVSAASAWEIGIKMKLGKLAFDGSVADAIDRHRFQPLPISVQHAEKAGTLPMIHTDPFDRLLIAQAQVEELIILTVDTQIQGYVVSSL